LEFFEEAVYKLLEQRFLTKRQDKENNAELCKCEIASAD
jgi:hypothetical protein